MPEIQHDKRQAQPAVLESFGKGEARYEDILCGGTAMFSDKVCNLLMTHAG